jgi:hypothetical protein
MSIDELVAYLDRQNAAEAQHAKSGLPGFKHVDILREGRWLIMTTQVGIRSNRCVVRRVVRMQMAGGGTNATIGSIRKAQWEWPLKL